MASRGRDTFSNVSQVLKSFLFIYSMTFSTFSLLKCLGNGHSVVRKDVALYDTNHLVSKYKQKVHTKVIDAKLNQIYKETINSTLEYIFQYTYIQDVCNNLKPCM